MAEPGPAAVAWVSVTVVYAPAPREVHEVSLRLPAGSTLGQALAASGLLTACPELDPAQADLGIWGRAARLDTVLHERDRVELYRPLRVDPKVARRERFARQGTRGTGLFARRRPGGKAGY